MVISRRLFHLQTSYLVTRYNPIRHIQWPKCRWLWPWSRSKVKVKFSKKCVKNLDQNGQKTNELFISRRLFHIISIITAFCDSFGRCPLVFFILWLLYCCQLQVLWQFFFFFYFVLLSLKHCPLRLICTCQFVTFSFSLWY